LLLYEAVAQSTLLLYEAVAQSTLLLYEAVAQSTLLLYEAVALQRSPKGLHERFLVIQMLANEANLRQKELNNSQCRCGQQHAEAALINRWIQLTSVM